MEGVQCAVSMLEQMARDAGIDIHSPLPQPPVSLDAVRVQRAGAHVVRALTQLRFPEDLASEALADAAHEAIALWSLLVAKAARVFSCTVDFDRDTWARDAEPNLLLMQHVRLSLSRVLEQLQRELPQDDMLVEVRVGVDAFDRSLLPLFNGSSHAARRYIDAFITFGVAPSPFCTEKQG